MCDDDNDADELSSSRRSLGVSGVKLYSVRLIRCPGWAVISHGLSDRAQAAGTSDTAWFEM